MLTYRCADYYKVTAESEGGVKPIFISPTPESRMLVYFLFFFIPFAIFGAN
jgi:hypothetical protein